jgi:alpha-glucosidase
MTLLLGEYLCMLPARIWSDLSLRLRVNIFDKSAEQFVLPSGFFDPPPKSENLRTSAAALAARGSPTHGDADSDLEFNYEASPFAFWITRRSDPGSTPIFDTRLTSLPSAPIPAFRSGKGKSDPSLVFDGFPLVFEDKYLQVTSIEWK